MGEVFQSKTAVFLLAIFVPVLLFGSCDRKSSNGTWAKMYGIDHSEEARSIQRSKDGGFIVLDRASGTNYILKLDGTGAILWQKMIPDTQTVYMVQETESGDLIAGGHEYEDREFVGFSLIKIDASGAFAWKKVYRTAYRPVRFAMCVDPRDNSVIVAGVADKPYGTYYVHADIMMLKVDSSGALLWQKIMMSGYVQLPGIIQGVITIAPDGGYYLGLDDNRSGQSGIGLMRIDRNGSLLWCRTYASTGGSVSIDPMRRYDSIGALEGTSDGGLVACGTTDWTSPSRLYGERQMVWVAKFDSAGTIQWSEELMSFIEPMEPSSMLIHYGEGNYPVSIRETADGGYAVLADTTISKMFRSMGYYYEDYNKKAGFLVRLNGEGDIIWQKKYRDKARTRAGLDLAPGDEGQIIGDEGGWYTMISNSIGVSSLGILREGGFVIAGQMYNTKSGESDALVMRTDDAGEISSTKMVIEDAGVTVGDYGFLAGDMNFPAEDLAVTVTDGVLSITDAALTVTKY